MRHVIGVITSHLNVTLQCAPEQPEFKRRTCGDAKHDIDHLKKQRYSVLVPLPP